MKKNNLYFIIAATIAIIAVLYITGYPMEKLFYPSGPTFPKPFPLLP